MKKIATSQAVYLPPIRIHMDELAALVSEAIPEDAEVEITTAGYVYDSWDELIEKSDAECLKEMDVIVSGPRGQTYIRLAIDKKFVLVKGPESMTMQLNHLVARLRKFVRWYTPLPEKPFGFGFVVAKMILAYVIWIEIFFLYASSLSGSWIRDTGAWIASVLTLPAGYLAWLWTKADFGTSRIWKVPRRSRRGWFATHRDALVRDLIVGTVVALLTFVLTKGWARGP